MKIAFITMNCLSANPVMNFGGSISYSFNWENFWRNAHNKYMCCPCVL